MSRNNARFKCSFGRSSDFGKIFFTLGIFNFGIVWILRFGTFGRQGDTVFGNSGVASPVGNCVCLFCVGIAFSGNVGLGFLESSVSGVKYDVSACG